MWHGPSLDEVLAGVTFEQAMQRPIAGGHSVAELVLHITTWATIPRERLRGPREATAEEDWPPTADLDPATWPDAVARMRQSYFDLAAAVRGMSDDELRANVPGADYPIEAMLRGVVEHGTYHGGQIALLKKAAAVPA